MTPEQWQKVKKVVAEALEREPGERGAYLDAVCTDPELRSQVDSLITAHENGDTDFMERPAIDPGAQPIGNRFGPYTILERIGAGGMGVVYKARDSKLGRLVALKLLAEGALAGSTARARLLREAQNASALNHPNIATIYEVGEHDGQVYIAMELVEGRALGNVIPPDGLTNEAVLRYGLQIAAALSHAHERGIVHRDLKPSNIVVTSDGHVKVLDFGLAKRLSASEIEEATRSQNTLTEPGEIVGTLQYMAPETLRGEQTDARTDIWALGTVLYEMEAGSPPFRGRTPYELSSAILREGPASFPKRVLVALQSVTQRCLAKEREQRYQRASEVRAALETIGLQAAPNASSDTRRYRRWISVGVGAVFVVALGLGVFEWMRPKEAVLPPASQENWTQLTDFADSAIEPALSPDGRILTFIRGDDTFIGSGQIYAKVLPDGEPVQLTHDDMEKMSPQFSPDGSTIAYTVGDWNTWSVPVLGGDAHLMLPNAEGLTWIDANHLLFSEIKSGIHMAVVTATTTRADSRDVYVPPRDRGMAHRSALSLDGKWVLVAEMDNGGWLPCRLVPFDGSSPGRRVGPQDAACTYVGWSPDQKWMFFSSDKGGRFHIWRQRYPDGDPQQLTSGATEEEGIAVAPDGASLITSVGLRESTVWVRDGQGERQVSSEGFAQFPSFSPDGKRLYYLMQPHGVSGAFVSGELWVVDLATNRNQHLLPDTLVTGYDISADGSEVVYSVRDGSGRSRLWLASLDFKFPPREFASPENEDEPHWDRANQIYFRAAEGKANFLYRMNADGSGRTKVISDPILEFYSVSPDARWAGAATGVPSPHMMEIPLEGGSPVAVCSTYCVPRWSRDGKTLSVAAYGMEGVKTYVLPVLKTTGLPALPRGEISGTEAATGIEGAKVMQGDIVIGPTDGLSATVREEVHRNLYRIPLQ